VSDSGGEFANRDRLHRSRQPRLTTAQGLLRVLPVIDIDQQAVPASCSAFTVTRGLAERLKPSVGAIGSAEPALSFERLAGCNGPRPRVRSRLCIIWVEKVLPPELRPSAGAGAGVVQYPLVQVVQFAVRSRAPNQARDRLDDQAEIALARS
jgi:hypothetical protein